MENIYEEKLHEYALKQNRYFSQYVKWLIDKDRSGKLAAPIASTPITATENKPAKFGKKAVKGFL